MPMSGFRFQSQEPPRAAPVAGPASSRAASRKPKPAPARIDPKFLKAARELRDRYLEEVARNPNLILPQGKYEVTRAALPGVEPLPYGRGSLQEVVHVKALPQAA